MENAIQECMIVQVVERVIPMERVIPTISAL